MLKPQFLERLKSKDKGTHERTKIKSKAEGIDKC